MICCITEKWWVAGKFTAIITERKTRITLFYLPRDKEKAKVWIAKLNRERNNLPYRVHICCDHFECDCFDSPWMLQSTLTFSGKSIQRFLLPEEILTKFFTKLYKNDTFLSNVKRLIANDRDFFLFLKNC